jgi:hypothetical protein
MKKTSILILALTGFALSSQAASILSDDFNYADGAIVGAVNSPWLYNSGTAGTAVATNSQLLLSTSRSEDIAAPVSGAPYPTNGSVAATYSKFTVKFTGVPSTGGGYFAHFNGENAPPSATLHRARVFASTSNAITGTIVPAGKFRLSIGNSSLANVSTAQQWDADLDTNVTYTIVTRLDLATGASTLWIDPTDESSTSVTATDSVAQLINVVYYSFRQATGIGNMAVDDLRVGTLFSDVAGANTAPSISAIGNQAIPANGSTGPLDFTVTDAESDASTLTVGTSSSNPTLVPNSAPNIVLAGTGANRTVTIVPAAGVEGSSLITLTVSDGVNEASTAFTVTVGAPTITAIPNQITISNVPTAAIPFTIGDAESPAGNLTLYVASSNPTLLPEANILLGGSGANRTVTLTPAADQIGVATVTLSVADGFNTNSSVFRLSVSPVLGLLLSDDFDYNEFLVPNALYQATDSPWLHANGLIFYELQVTNGVCYLNSTLTEDLAAPLANGPYAASSAVVFYSGFTVKCTQLPTQSGASSYFAHFKDSLTGTTFRAKVFAETNNAAAGKFRLGIANNGNLATQFPQDLEVGVTYSVVTRYNSGIGEATLWVNPASESSANVSGTDNLQTTPVGHYSLRQDSGFGQIELGQLRVATSFAEVVTGSTPNPIPLAISLNGNDVTLTWANPAFKLYSASAVNGTYTEVVGATSPYSTPISGNERYFRLVYP